MERREVDFGAGWKTATRKIRFIMTIQGELKIE
jgi:hypothetical protein